MKRLRNTSNRPDDHKRAIAIKSQRVLYVTIAILGIVALAFVVRIWLLQPTTAFSQSQAQPALSVQQGPPTFLPSQPSVAYSVEAESLFTSLNCICGACNDTLADCDCGVAREMKGYASDSLVETGASKPEVMDRLVEKYGPEALVGGDT